MSQDFTNSKKLTGSTYPIGAYDSGNQGVERIEPLLTGKALRKRFLWGIPLVSPMTGEKLSDSDLKDYVKRAINQLEIDAKTNIFSVNQRFRLPFDPALYNANIWCEVPVKPVQFVHRLAICSASYSNTGDDNVNSPYPTGAEIYKIPNEWIDVSYAQHGKIFVNPINPAFSAIGTTTAIAASGATILTFIGQQGWVPAYWTIEATTGLSDKNGNLPVFINECIGQLAAVLLLDNLIPLYRTANQSLGVDGLQQSVNDLTYQLLTNKRKDLLEQYEKNAKKVKAMYNSSFFVSNI